MANKEDPTLPNWQKTQEQYEKEGWRMIGDDPLHWENIRTGITIDKRPKKGGK